MKAAVLYDFNTPLQIEQFDMPDIADDQVRVRLEASGVCHSDWHIVKGEWVDINRPPVILGHEGAGRGRGSWPCCTQCQSGRSRCAILDAQLRSVRDVPGGLPQPL